VANWQNVPDVPLLENKGRMEDIIRAIRTEFPILSTKVYGKDLIYFDNGATTQKPRRVIEKMEQGYYQTNSNIHRGVHFLSQRATEAHENARERVRRFLNAGNATEIIFTRGTTEAINLVAFSFGEAFCKEGDEIVVSVMEHHSNIVPWQLLCERKKMTLKVIPMNDAGELSMDAFEALLTSNVKLVSVTHVSNVLGTVNPVAEMIQKAHALGIPVLVDGAQAVPHIKVDVQALDADFYAFSAHKIYGPTGIGALYGKSDWLNSMPPYQGGGEMIEQVRFEKTTYNVLPYKFEAGTPDFIGSTALAEALDFVDEIGLEKIATYEHQLLDYAVEALKKIDGMRFIGTAENKSAVLSFLMGSIHPFDTGTLLDHLGIAVRTGHHCAQPLIDRLGIDGTVRASFAIYNTPEEVEIMAKALLRIQSMF
jgi:cysteine desulfurase/selenocysteine lyase